ncbi:MAG TPA: T9SS type A sorting domain-containing protein [candidate division WOR-3 bacterium]|uniref:carboxypeptidase T n=1 Tax=candidate division WOR-3 bacterium TaxID=2052148 RepID=A0A9C9ENP9_UNCW3|nr:T9SS type A sorting domain-containing protein [candidate division WOR-3 bacterium]
MKRSVLIIMLLCTLLSARTMWVRIYYDGDLEKEILLNKNYDILTGNARAGYFEYFLDEKLVNELESQGFGIEILHPDIINYLEENYGHLRMNFGYYYTYDEMVQELDQIAANYPNITHKVSLGQSWQNREIWAMKISDNASQNEAEPTVLITGVHHAREPIGTSTCIDFIKWLVNNYGTNDTATTIVTTDEVWIVPCVNPDGYVFNETYEDPWGNGWRKNCRDNNNSGQMEPESDGVDLNRNYGYMWGYDNNGSSPDPTSETYRGPSAFSEPETQAMRVLCDTFAFLYALNYHSYGNYLIVPWGYINDWVPAPDSATYHVMAESMTTYIGVPNNYTWGTAGQTVGYNANGVSDDWMYGEQTEKPKCLAFTAEVGESFWQGATDSSIIVTHCNETRPMNIYLCYKAAILGIQEKDEPVALSNLAVFPNPADAGVNIRFNLAQSTGLKLRLYDATGRLVVDTKEVRYPAGSNSAVLSLEELSSGIYFLGIFKGSEEVLRNKLIVVRR